MPSYDCGIHTTTQHKGKGDLIRLTAIWWIISRDAFQGESLYHLLLHILASITH